VVVAPNADVAAMRRSSNARVASRILMSGFLSFPFPSSFGPPTRSHRRGKIETFTGGAEEQRGCHGPCRTRRDELRRGADECAVGTDGSPAAKPASTRGPDLRMLSQFLGCRRRRTAPSPRSRADTRAWNRRTKVSPVGTAWNGWAGRPGGSGLPDSRRVFDLPAARGAGRSLRAGRFFSGSGPPVSLTRSSRSSENGRWSRSGGEAAFERHRPCVPQGRRPIPKNLFFVRFV